MEIERKYLVASLPPDLESYPFHQIEQAYLCTDPVLRVRRQDDDYYLTYKSKGLMAREEYNLPLTGEAYAHLLPKADGRRIVKKRYVIPLSGADGKKGTAPGDGLTVELDVFEGSLAPLILAEVEFPTVEAADAFSPPPWFGEDVTYDGRYQNSALSAAT